MIPIAFPALRTVLWDQTSLGDAILVGPEVCCPRTIRVRRAVLASLCERGRRTSLVFGHERRRRPHPSAAPEEDEEEFDGWELDFTAFDAGNGEPLPKPTLSSLALRNKATTAGTTKLLHIKSVVDPKIALECALESWFGACKTPFRPSNVIKFYGFVAAASSGRTHPAAAKSVRLTVEAYVPGLYMVFTRVPSLSLLSTPLARSLQQQQTTPLPAYGLITLNETRKAVLLLEDDPLAYQVPVVGVWFRATSPALAAVPPQGTLPPMPTSLQLDVLLQRAVKSDPAIYAGCVRYAANEYLRERVCPVDSPRTLLVCLLDYAQQAIFAECRLSTLDEDHVLHLFAAVVECGSGKDDDDDAPVAAKFRCLTSDDAPNDDARDFNLLVRASTSTNSGLLATDWIQPDKATVMQTVHAMRKKDVDRRRAEDWLSSWKTTAATQGEDQGGGGFSLPGFLAKQREEIAAIERLLDEPPPPTSPIPPPPPPPPPAPSSSSSLINHTNDDADDADYDDDEVRAIEAKYLGGQEDDDDDGR